MEYLPKKRKNNNSERGFTLVEQMMTVLIISLGVLVWLNVVRVINRGTIVSKDNLRAQNLALSKLEDFKSMAKNSSYDGTWNSVTKTSLALAYGQWNISTFGTKNYTWKVSSGYAETVPGLGVVTPVPSWAGCTTCTANMITITAEVRWTGLSGPKVLSMTSSATNYRSN